MTYMKMTIDRIEGEVAVLVSREEMPQTVNVPCSFLPYGSREGDIVTVQIERDEEATRETKNRVRDLIAKLKNKR
jgi:hypothetical protein